MIGRKAAWENGLIEPYAISQRFRPWPDQPSGGRIRQARIPIARSCCGFGALWNSPEYTANDSSQILEGSCNSSVGTPSMPERTVATDVPGLKPRRISLTASPARTNLSRSAARSIVR